MSDNFTDVINNKLLKKKAITSYSIILYTIIDNKIYYLLGQVRDTIAFREYIKCCITDDNIKFYLQNMSLGEKKRLITEPFESLIDDVLLNHSGRTYKSTKNCIEQFELNRTLYDGLLKDTTIGIPQNPWIFPKGKIEKNEEEIDCALREFEEETRIKRDKITIIGPDTLEETYHGLDNQLYKTIYYTGFMKYSDFKDMKPSIYKKVIKTHKRTTISEELSSIKWFDYTEASDSLDETKKYILRIVNTRLIFSLERTRPLRRNSI